MAAANVLGAAETPPWPLVSGKFATNSKIAPGCCKRVTAGPRNVVIVQQIKERRYHTGVKSPSEATMRVATLIALAGGGRYAGDSRLRPTRSAARLPAVNSAASASPSSTRTAACAPRSRCGRAAISMAARRSFPASASSRITPRPDLHERLAKRRMGPDRHSSLPAADAVRAAGLHAVLVLVGLSAA